MSKVEIDEPNLAPVDPLLLVKDEQQTKKPSFLERFSGILYALIASVLFVLPTFIIKQLEVDLLDAIILRFLLQTIFTFIFVSYKNYTIFGGTTKQIVLQSLCCFTGALGVLLFFLAIRYIEIPDANTLCYTRVVWTVVLSVIVYRERPTLSTLIALPLTLIGVVFVTQPTFLFSTTTSQTNSIDYKYRFIGFAMSLAVAFTSAINVLLFKQLISTSKDIKPSILTLQFTFAVLLLLIGNQFYKIFYLEIAFQWDVFFSWKYALSSCISLMAVLGSILTQKAIKREHPAVFSLLGSSEIIVALILQNMFTSHHSNFNALIGSALVILSVVVLGIGRILSDKKQT